jgi:hypothetical protein
MGHSPSRASSSNNPPIANKSTATQGTINYNVVDVSEWYYQPKRPSKSTPSSSQHKNQENLTTPIAFRTWDFIGIQQVFDGIFSIKHFYFIDGGSNYPAILLHATLSLPFTLADYRWRTGCAGTSRFTVQNTGIRSKCICFHCRDTLY